jgi:hypothetical protein
MGEGIHNKEPGTNDYPFYSKVFGMSTCIAFFFGPVCNHAQTTYIRNPLYNMYDHLCGLVVRISGYRSRGPGFDSRR